MNNYKLDVEYDGPACLHHLALRITEPHFYLDFGELRYRGAAEWIALRDALLTGGDATISHDGQNTFRFQVRGEQILFHCCFYHEPRVLLETALPRAALMPGLLAAIDLLIKHA